MKHDDQLKEYVDKMETATTELAAAAKTNNLANLEVAFGKAAKSSTTCHDNLRAK